MLDNGGVICGGSWELIPKINIGARSGETVFHYMKVHSHYTVIETKEGTKHISQYNYKEVKYYYYLFIMLSYSLHSRFPDLSHQVIGKYTLLGRINGGAQGEIYKGKVHKINTPK